MRFALALCLLAILVAGCSSPSSDSIRTSSDPAAADSPGQPPGNGTVASAAKPYSFEGSLTPGACVPKPEGRCLSIHLGSPKWSDPTEETHVVRAALTLSWTAIAPTTDTLSFSLQRATSCGEDCWKGENVAPPVQGKSPLALDVATPALGEDEALLVVVREVAVTPAPADAWAHPEQPFKVEGTLTIGN